MGLLVAISRRWYTCRESATTISPPSRRASSKASRDLPIPVGPTTTGTCVMAAGPLPNHGERRGVGRSVVSSEVAGQLLPLDQKPRWAPVGTGDRLFGRL